MQEIILKKKNTLNKQAHKQETLFVDTKTSYRLSIFTPKWWVDYKIYPIVAALAQVCRYVEFPHESLIVSSHFPYDVHLLFFRFLYIVAIMIWLKHNPFKGCPRGVMVKAIDCGIVVNEFVLQSRYYVHFRANIIGERYEPPYPPSDGLNSTTTVLLGEWLWHWGCPRGVMDCGIVVCEFVLQSCYYVLLRSFSGK